MRERGTTTGVSAHDRCATVRLMADAHAKLRRLHAAGAHRATPSGRRRSLQARRPHRGIRRPVQPAGMRPIAVLAEVMNEDGMARVPQLMEISEKLILAYHDCRPYRYRRRTETVKRVASTTIPTRKYGPFTVHAYEASVEPRPRHRPRKRGAERQRSDSGSSTLVLRYWRPAGLASMRLRSS